MRVRLGVLVTAGCVAALTLCLTSQIADAQVGNRTASGGVARRTTVDATLPKVVVVSFEAENPMDGLEAAEAVRARLTRIHNNKRFWIVQGRDISYNLGASGYDTVGAPAPPDARQLAFLMGADILVMGRVEKEGSNFTVTPRMLSVRNWRLVQPMDSFSGRRLDQIAIQMQKPLEEVFEPVPELKKCEVSLSEFRFQDAIAAAKAAQQIYPTSTIAKTCLAIAYNELSEGPDSAQYPAEMIIALAQEVLDELPDNYIALDLLQMQEYRRGNHVVANDILARMIPLDLVNTRNQEELARRLAASGEFGAAKATLEDAISQHPGDPRFQRLKAFVHMALQEWDDAASAFAELAHSDTAALDTLYYQRYSSVNRNRGQLGEAIQVARAGAEKFPDNINLHLLRAQLLRENKQYLESVGAARGALAIQPDNVGIYIQMAETFRLLEMPDSVVAVLAESKPFLKNADDSLRVGDMGFAVVQQVYNLTADTTTTMDTRLGQWETVIRLAQTTEATIPADGVKLYVSLSHLKLAEYATNSITRMVEEKAAPEEICAAARIGREHAMKIQEFFAAGGSRALPDRSLIPQIMGASDSQRTYLSDVVSTTCKGSF